ncbi:MAG: bifunctional [glutamine synthetase] adenylyltransferase/[glutamine synthetase]-adenylyl-L-tyrosine phosphorylase [Alphaproteobacteria bacterium]|nr:MAG: bifunctional [glutamine synthetase] adenylyltransferase/[glutamine synthetase]-adenylyl-L-tyrosine phosphorylase [Alphaproteobacteria bacterium]
MSTFVFFEKSAEIGPPHDGALAAEVLRDLSRLLQNEATLSQTGRDLLADDRAHAFLTCLLGNSPYLTRLVKRHVGEFLAFCQTTPDDAFDRLLQEAEAQLSTLTEMSDVMAHLRLLKAKSALLIAMADIAGHWSLMETTRALTRLADSSLQSALRFLLRRYAAKGDMVLVDEQRPEMETGIIVLAMGKYGAGELNYSSDVDIIVFFEEGRVPVTEKLAPQKLCIRLVRDLVKIMQEPTGDGYVFRTDLRLRPDAGATAVALSTDAAHFYYETMGQNWERAAMIKARAAAGDLEAGQRFLKQLEPYIWRRYMDFAAIEDVHSIKRQIHAHKGYGQIAIEGHNVKLGRGGIREIEFFAQTQQLIGGGKNPNLRDRTTYGALDALVAAKIVKAEVRDDLVQAYEFLRLVEHRIQMIADEQTHVLPKTAEGVAHVAHFCGFADVATFRNTLTHHLRTVQNHYAELFEEAPSLGNIHGNLVFTGVEDDPGTLETLKEMGFERPSDATEMIRGWHHGRLRVTRSERARAILTKLIPSLLEAMAGTANPSAALANFHRFLQGLPAGVQLFSMLYSNPHLMVLLAEILGTAPRLASSLAKNARVLEVLLEPDFFGELETCEELAADLKTALSLEDYFEGRLDAARIWSRDRRFRVGVNLLHGDCTPEASAEALSDIADVTLQALQKEVAEELVPRFGRLSGELAIIAMGKLGSRELSATSDLDLIFVYETEDPEAVSDGAKPLHNSQYYARFAQRFISALQSPTAEGILYEVDARLRPSGKSGPLAVRFAGFENYQLNEAWTWEKMALTRARVVTGSPALCGRIEDVIQRTLCETRDRAATLADAVDMRERMAKEFSRENIWDMKHVRGGLVDIEFIAQAFQLVVAPQDPAVLNTNTEGALIQLGGGGYLPPEDVARLVSASRLHHRLTQVTRFCVEGTFEPDKASKSLLDLMANVAEVDSFERLPSHLAAVQAEVVAIFNRVMSA